MSESAGATNRTPEAFASPSVTVGPSLSRPDFIAPRAASHVTMAKPETPLETAPSSSPERQGSETPWMEALRRRVEEATPSPGEASSERALARLARRLEQGKGPPGAANDQARDGPEPDM
jgi:hypothetical protein